MAQVTPHQAPDGDAVIHAAILLDDLRDAGLLEEDLDDRFAGRRNEGLEDRASRLKRTIDRMEALDAATA